MENRFRDVHYYDRNLEDNFRPSRVYTPEEKSQLFGKLAPQLPSPEARAMVILILRQLGTGANYDSVNQVNCEDVLAEILSHPLDPDLMAILNEQLSDNYRLGQCPQGRSWRLLQVWRAVVTSAEEGKRQRKLDRARARLEIEMARHPMTSEEKDRWRSEFLRLDPPDRERLIHRLKSRRE